MLVAGTRGGYTDAPVGVLVSEAGIEDRVFVGSVGEEQVVMRERRELCGLRSDLANATLFLVLLRLENIDLGNTTALRAVWTRMLFTRAST